MAKDVIIRGVTYQGIDKLSLPVSGGSALFRDTSGANAAAGDLVRGKTAYGATGLITGTHDLPSGSISITDNGVYDVTDYASAVVSVSGGGGGPTASDAILTVKAPANSIVTMAKGNTILTPTLWTTAADSSLECALFVIESSLFDSQNAWTVTATSGSSTASGTVVIDDNLQYEMALNYRLYLIHDGKVNTSAWTAVLLARDSAGGGEVTVDSVDYYQIYNSNTSNDNRNTICYFTPKQTFPVSFANLVMSAKSRGYDDRPFGLMSNYGAVGTAPTYYKSTSIKNGNTTVLSDLTEFHLDLSDVASGEYWFGFSTLEVSSGGIRTGEVLVRDFYLTNEVLS